MIVSLFSGYGGLDLAVEAATGLSTVAVADIDKGARMILEHRFPGVPNLGDVSKVDFTQWRDRATVLTGGYPCQPFSGAGARKGTDDPRHLFPHVARAIGEMGPRLVVLENVRGHLSLGFDTVLGALSDLGYDARWGLVRASDVGAPHPRARLFIVATAQDTDREPGNQWGVTAPGQAQGRGARAHARGRGGTPDTHTPGLAWHEGPATAARQRYEPTRGRSGGVPTPYAPGPGLAQRPRWTRDDSQGRQAATGGAADTERWGRYAAAVARWEAVTRPAPAPHRHGRLSPAFVEWMMGLPEGWVTDVPGLTRNQQHHALGNGVVPQQALYALRALGVAA